jgi:dihydrodipicolinate synthase/N-acetylneuraminate lyase
MNVNAITSETLTGSVIAVPPLARRQDLAIDRQENEKIIRHLEAGGVRTLLYGGNAVLYHIAVSEYSALLEMLEDLAAPDTLVIPSVGPAYGMMMDQAEILRQTDFPTAMILPQHDVATPRGIATGIRLFAEAFGKPVVLYIKRDGYLAVTEARALVDDGLVSWIKYAVVRERTGQDEYLRQLVENVPADVVVSGIGEQPALIHMREFGLVGFTSGCVCIAPRLSMEMLRAVQSRDFPKAEEIQAQFRPLEDLRNQIHPVSVLHRAVSLAGIAETGPVLPLLSEITDQESSAVKEAAGRLMGLTE